MKTLQETIEDLIKNPRPPMSRMERAISNYHAIVGKRAPDDLHISWAERA